MDNYRHFRRDRQGRQGGWVALCVGEWLDCMALTVGDETVERLWVRMKGKVKKVDVVVGVYCQPLNQDDDTDELFYNG